MKTWFFLKVIGGYLRNLALTLAGVAFVCLIVWLVYMVLEGLLALTPLGEKDSRGNTGSEVLAFILTLPVTIGTFVTLICAGEEADKKYKEFLKREKENAK